MSAGISSFLSSRFARSTIGLALFDFGGGSSTGTTSYSSKGDQVVEKLSAGSICRCAVRGTCLKRLRRMR